MWRSPPSAPGHREPAAGEAAWVEYPGLSGEIPRRLIAAQAGVKGTRAASIDKSPGAERQRWQRPPAAKRAALRRHLWRSASPSRFAREDRSEPYSARTTR